MKFNLSYSFIVYCVKTALAEYIEINYGFELG
jgi:hypothetical protein